MREQKCQVVSLHAVTFQKINELWNHEMAAENSFLIHCPPHEKILSGSNQFILISICAANDAETIQSENWFIWQINVWNYSHIRL